MGSRVSGFVVAFAALVGLLAGAAPADSPPPTSTTQSGDLLRTGWYPNQPTLTPELVSGRTFGRLFAASVNGQVYAQPLVWHDVLLAVTQTNWIYGLDPVTGARHWARNVAVPWNGSDIPCGAILPKIGITGTPAIDPATGTAYFLAKTYEKGSSGPAAYWLHAVDSSTGRERSNFPVRIQGSAQNDASLTFNATPELQRPGLLLMNGVVYAAFGGLCDLGRYQGWIVGVSTSGNIRTMWSAIHSPVAKGAGIWQSGGGIVSDGPRQIIVTTGNGGTPTDDARGNRPPPSLGQSVVRLEVQPDGQLKPTDFFTPHDGPALDPVDADLGSGAPMGLPPTHFGTDAYPRLAVQVGKQGYVYLLDLTNLGGKSQGPGGSDLVVKRLGPYGGFWSKPTPWPGDGGYVYIPTATPASRPYDEGVGSGLLRAFKYGLDGARKPTLRLVATSTAAFNFGSSAPVVTSNGTASGSALLWIVWMSGPGSQLRAYDPVPVRGHLHLRWRAPIGTATKFAMPGVAEGRIYVGTRDGHVLGFGARRG